MSTTPFLLEVIVCSLADAIAAEAGGATRLEVISHYELGGLTPSLELVQGIVDRVKTPARVMLRESEPFVLPQTAEGEKEAERLCDLARSFSALPIDGFVLGFLQPVGNQFQIDHSLVARILSAAPTVNTTFHRAFEDLPDPLAALAELKRHPQIDWVLSRGKGEAWAQELDRFAVWEQAARPEIGMLLGGGTDAEAIRLFCRHTQLRAFHVGRAVREGERLDGPVQAEKVRALRELLESENPLNSLV